MLLANSARRNHKPNQKSENRAEKKPPNRKVCTKCYTSLSILHIVAVSFWTSVVVPKFGNELETRVRGMNNLAKTKKRSSQREEWAQKEWVAGSQARGRTSFVTILHDLRNFRESLSAPFLSFFLCSGFIVFLIIFGVITQIRGIDRQQVRVPSPIASHSVI